MLPHGNVLIMKEDQSVEAILPQEEAGEDVQVIDGILSPGFVNGHCHLELSHLHKLIPPKTGMVGFIEQVLAKRTEATEIIEEACKLADEEMQKNGIVAVGDICNTTHSLSTKLKSKIYYHNFIEVTGFVAATAQKRFEDGLNVYETFAKHFPNQTTMVPHAPYSVSSKLFALITKHSLNKIISIHNQESYAEQEFFEKKTGDFLRLYKNLGIDISFFNPTKTSLQYCLPYLINSEKCILVHNGYMPIEDQNVINSINKEIETKKFWLCFCSNANTYIGNEAPKVEFIKTFENEIIIGTDSLASNNQLCIASEIRDILYKHPSITLARILKMANHNGAKALGISHQFGEFKKGLKPGKIILKNLLTVC
jgi:cytosine/adenosine deaminase-related metal-dependent hydrolase